MASLLPGYSYDIFISYRQKDNKYDGWVTEFVENLRKELEATFKEDVSIYFDGNAEDGLHETHDVDDSLREKVRCLVFIPIISHTYCDPTCFAWQKEFLTFKKIASEDPVGLKVRLSGGNVASRILPVLIHEIDHADKSLLESELGPLRSVDFVFRATGVNRALRAKDDELMRQGTAQVLYRDQVNKVANAVKGIISGIRNPGTTRKDEGTASGLGTIGNNKRLRWKRMGAIGVLVILLVAGYFLIEARYRRPVSVAVLAFVDMSAEQDQEWFADGISEELINMLQRVPTLEVRARTSSFSFKGKNEDIQTIADKLNVTHILEGSVRKSASRIRVTAKLIKARDGSQVWSETFEQDQGNVLTIQDEIATAVVSTLSQTLFAARPEFGRRQANQEAVNFFLQGKYNTMHHKPALAIKNYLAALRIDSLYTKAWAGLSWAYLISGPGDSVSMKEIKRKQALYAQKAYSLDASEPDAVRSMIQLYMSQLDFQKMKEMTDVAMQLPSLDPELIMFATIVQAIEGNSEEEIRLLQKASEKDPLNYLHHTTLSDAYLRAGDLDRGESSTRTAMDLGRDVPSVNSWMYWVYFARGHYEKALQSVDTATVRHYPDFVHYKYFPLLALGRVEEANHLLDSIKRTLIDIDYQVGTCYAFANEFDSAFHYFSKARDKQQVQLIFFPYDLMIPKKLKADPRYTALLKELKVLN